MGWIALVGTPDELAAGDVVGPKAHVARLHDERQTLVATGILSSQFVGLKMVAEGVAAQHKHQYRQHSNSPPHPFWHSTALTVGVEPFVLDSGDAIRGIKTRVGFVKAVQQGGVVAHETVLAMRHIDGSHL